MMTIIKCDKCGLSLEDGQENDQGISIKKIYFSMGHSHSDKLDEKDLCTNCLRDLWRFLEPKNKSSSQEATNRLLASLYLQS